MHFHVVALFPEAFESYLASSIIGRAIRDKKIKVSFYNPRDFTNDRWRRVDQKPYGGGPGMVLEAKSVLRAALKAIGRKTLKDIEVIFFDTSGKEFTNTYARTLARKKKHVVFICGRYEGVDARVQNILRAKKISIGKYTLTGGELPAMVMIDSIARQIPGVLGKQESLEESRGGSFPTYTRPEVFTLHATRYTLKRLKVPKVLLSGDHKKIATWRAQAARRRASPT